MVYGCVSLSTPILSIYKERNLCVLSRCHALFYRPAAFLIRHQAYPQYLSYPTRPVDLDLVTIPAASKGSTLQASTGSAFLTHL